MPSTDVPDMQPRTRIRRFGEYATSLDRTMENSNMKQLLGADEEEARVPSRTEERNQRTRDIDTVPTLELLTLLNAEDAAVADAVKATLPVLAVVVDLVVERLRAGGLVHYFGEGSSGRIGVLDAAEVVPTFGTDPRAFIAHQAGGDGAVMTAVEGAEDNEELGRRAGGVLTSRDVAIGLSASGRTPWVGGALRAARAAGALTV